MTVVKRTALVRHSCEQMFQLVQGVEDYPKFLPWCVAAEFLNQSSHEMVATLHGRIAGINQSFTTRNRYREPEQIDMSLVKGPFQSLSAQWRFQSIEPGQGCEVQFLIDYSFKRTPLQMALSPAFRTIAQEMIDAFVQRADQQYGALK